MQAETPGFLVFFIFNALHSVRCQHLNLLVRLEHLNLRSQCGVSI